MLMKVSCLGLKWSLLQASKWLELYYLLRLNNSMWHIHIPQHHVKPLSQLQFKFNQQKHNKRVCITPSWSIMKPQKKASWSFLKNESSHLSPFVVPICQPVNPYGPRQGTTNPTPKKKSARTMTRPAPPWRVWWGSRWAYLVGSFFHTQRKYTYIYNFPK